MFIKKISIITSIFLVFISLSQQSSAEIDILRVDVDTENPGNGSTWGAPYTSIQGAIDNAYSDSEIWVKGGYYTETLTIPSSLSVYGGFAGTESSRDDRDSQSNTTIIDAGGNFAAIVTMNTVTNVTVDGFLLTGGESANGGGFSLTSVDATNTISNCFISGNTSTGSGGGIYLDASSPAIEDCTITGNTSAQYGGGIYLNNASSPTITDCAITSNTAESHGGGIAVINGAPLVTRCRISGNSTSTTNNSFGGGVYERGSSSYVDCTITGNTSKTTVEEFIFKTRRPR